MSRATEMRDDGGNLRPRAPSTSAIQDAWIDLIADVVVAEVLAEEQAKVFKDNVGDQEDTQ